MRPEPSWSTAVTAAAALVAAACGGTQTQTSSPDEAPPPRSTAAVTPVLVVADVERAAAWYADVLGGTATVRGGRAVVAFGDLDDNAAIELWPPDADGRRAPPGDAGAGAAIHVYVQDVDAAVARFTADGARTLVPLGDMFWGDRFAELVDPFGHRVSLATHQEDVSDDELARRLNLIGEAAAAGQPPPSFPPERRAADWLDREYHVVTPALVVRGAADALAFYAETFGVTEVSRIPLPDGRLMHAEAEVTGWRLMLADELVDQGGPSAPPAAPWSFAVRVPATGASQALVRDPDGTFRDPWNQRWLEQEPAAWID